MKKLALVLALFVGVATTTSAQEAKTLPKWAQPQNEADKPAVERAKAKTQNMVKSLKLDEKQELIVLEINVGLERRIATLENYTGADKQNELQMIEERRTEMMSHYLTPKQLDNYKKQNKIERQ